MSLIEPTNTIGPEPAAPADPTHTYADTEAGGGGQTITEPQDVVVEAPPAIPSDAGFDALPKYWQDQINEKRDAEARYRLRAKGYDETFDGMDDSLREGWLELIRVANSGDEGAMDQLASMLGFEIEGEPQTPLDAPEQPQYLTREEAAEIARQEARNLYEADRAQQQEADSIKAVSSEAEKLGYDVSTRAYVDLLFEANKIDQSTIPPGKSLLEVAHEHLEAERQAEYDAWVQSKVDQANGSPVAPSGNGGSPSIERTPKSWDEARDMLHERLNNAR